MRGARRGRISVFVRPAILPFPNERTLGAPRLHLCVPQSKVLACGDEGMGAMAEVETGVAAVKRALRG